MTGSLIEAGMFLLTVGFISLSGALMPGPVFAATVIKGSEKKNAGLWITAGHLLVEIPLILLIAAGLYYLLRDEWILAGIGLIGGALLIYLGLRMIQMRKKESVVKNAFPYHPLIAGIITTTTNPYFILWWATIGASLIFWSLSFGVLGLVGMILVHESCDLGWNYLVGYTSFASKKLWTDAIRSYVFGICGIILMVFGIYFLFSFLLK